MCGHRKSLYSYGIFLKKLEFMMLSYENQLYSKY